MMNFYVHSLVRNPNCLEGDWRNYVVAKGVKLWHAVFITVGSVDFVCVIAFVIFLVADYFPT